MSLKKSAQLIIIFFISLIAAKSASAAITIRPMLNLGLVGYWDLNEGTGSALADQSGNNNNGSISGTVAWTTGKYSNGLDFNRNNGAYVGISHATSSLNFAGANQAFSISLWVKTPTVTAGYWPRLISKADNASSRAFELFYHGDQDRYIFQLWNGSTIDIVYSPTNLDDDQWHHLVVIRDSAMKFYFDGREVGQNVDNSGWGINYNNSLPIRLGALANSTDPNISYDGNLDEVRIYNRVLSASEINRLYYLTRKSGIRAKTVTDNGLVGYWSFEEGTGTKAGDMSGSGNNGTASGSPIWIDGKRGRALSFNGTSDFIDYGDKSSFTFGNGSSDQPFTTTAWVKLSDFSSAHSLISKYNGIPSEWLVIYSGNQIGINMYTSSETGYIGRFAPFDSNYLNQWVNIVTTYSGNKSSTGIAVYINGVRADTTDVNGGSYTGMSDTVAPLRVGARFHTGAVSLPWQGRVDEVRVYNRALSATEVASLYTASKKIIKVNASQNTKLTTGLVGMWSFNGPDISGNIAFDRSGGGRNGTLLNGPVLDSGKVGQGVKFDNSDDTIEIANSADLGEGSALTVSAWVKFNNPTNDNTKDVISKYRSGAGWEQWQIIKDRSGATNKMWFDVWNSSDTSVSAVSDNTWPADTSWHHVAGVYDGAYVYLYGDGVSLDSSANPQTGPIKDYTNNICIGGGWSGSACQTGQPLDGYIDEARIYNRALSAAEIKRLYNLGR